MSLIDLSPWAKDWASDFDSVARELLSAVPSSVRIEHVGSTAVPGLESKPVIDILVGVNTARDFAPVENAILELGFTLSGDQGPEAARFLQRAESPPINLHLTLVGSSPWVDLLGFRDRLLSNEAIREEYAALKRRLASVSEGDLNRYTAGKSEFVAAALKVPMTTRRAAERILDHQQAEHTLAAKFRNWSLLLQFGVAAVAAASVFVDDHSQLLSLAVVGVLLLGIWFTCDHFYRRHRAAGDQARRLVLTVNGLGETVGDLHVIESSFTASTAKLSPQSIETYFASREPSGLARLGEMLDESAYFTGDLQGLSGQLMVLSLLGMLGAAIIAGLVLGPNLDQDGQVAAARVVLAFLVLVVSSDVLGAALGHLEARRAMDSVRLRLSGARRLNYPSGDVLQAMADYNAAVEGAPQPLGFLYQARRAELDRNWAIYKQETGLGAPWG